MPVTRRMHWTGTNTCGGLRYAKTRPTTFFVIHTSLTRRFVTSLADALDRVSLSGDIQLRARRRTLSLALKGSPSSLSFCQERADRLLMRMANG
jgi:hypothetical protein